MIEQLFYARCDNCRRKFPSGQDIYWDIAVWRARNARKSYQHRTKLIEEEEIMSDRVSVYFVNNRKECSPGIYLHWSGAEVYCFLEGAEDWFTKGDIDYSAARFCGYCHNKIRGNSGLGLVSVLPYKKCLEDDSWENYSPGDAGIVIVNVDTGEVSIYDSYLNHPYYRSLNFSE